MRFTDERRRTNDEGLVFVVRPSSFVSCRSLFGDRLDGIVRWSWAPVAVQHAERGLLVQLIALRLPRNGVVQLPEEHRANPGCIILAAHLEGADDPLGLLIVRNVVAEAVAGRVVARGPAELGDPDLLIAHARFDHPGADIFDPAEVELAARRPARARAGVIGP